MVDSSDTSTESKETEKTQLVATGSIAGVDHTKVEAEAAAHGIDLEGYKNFPNDNQGGN